LPDSLATIFPLETDTFDISGKLSANVIGFEPPATNGIIAL